MNVLKIFVPLYIFLISIIALTAQQPVHLSFFAAISVIFLAVHFLERNVPWAQAAQFVLLLLFHWLSRSDWCIALYLTLFLKFIYREQNKKQTIIWCLLFASAYSGTRLFYTPWSPVLGTQILLQYVFFGMFAVLFQKLYLHPQNENLSNRDQLTELVNFQEYHSQLEHLLLSTSNLFLVLIDCTDLKSMNDRGGFQAGNRLLKQIAEILRTIFPNAYIIARYGGDEFALALKRDLTSNTEERMLYLLQEELPKRTGIPLTYGYAIFPIDGKTKDELLLTAEKRLFAMKREKWLKREENMLRNEKLRVVGELASGMAHEIRNPLTTIKGFLQISKVNGYNIRPWYELIMDEITRMSELTAEFLQFSKPHPNQFKVQDLHICIQRVMSLTETEAARLGHTIEFIRNQHPLNILVDQDKMVQLLLNLIKNAFEAMSEGGHVTLLLYPSKNNAVVEIQDTGKGIPPSDLDKIFHPFYTTKENGTGIGLYICHKIVQDHNGTMEVQSSDKGTTFKITFPLAEVSEEVTGQK
jgi:diguanylate cyclase (GGDEF)-like protein